MEKGVAYQRTAQPSLGWRSARENRNDGLRIFETAWVKKHARFRNLGGASEEKHVAQRCWTRFAREDGMEQWTLMDSTMTSQGLIRARPCVMAAEGQHAHHWAQPQHYLREYGP